MSVTEEDVALAKSLVGRTITRVDWLDESPDHEWAGHEIAHVYLDDGRVIEFGGWGYDAWGATIDVIPIPVDRDANNETH